MDFNNRSKKFYFAPVKVTECPDTKTVTCEIIDASEVNNIDTMMESITYGVYEQHKANGFVESKNLLDIESPETAEIICNRLNELVIADSRFPNGFSNWYETFYEVVSYLMSTIDNHASMAQQTHAEGGRGRLYELAEDLTNKFEQKHVGVFWDGEYFDGIDAFLNEENERYVGIDDQLEFLIKRIGKEFSCIINQKLTTRSLNRVRKFNDEGVDKSICHTHDYCDANELMATAFKRIMCRDFIFYDDTKPETKSQHEEDQNLFNDAWTYARENNFKFIYSY